MQLPILLRRVGLELARSSKQTTTAATGADLSKLLQCETGFSLQQRLFMSSPISGADKYGGSKEADAEVLDNKAKPDRGQPVGWASSQVEMDRTKGEHQGPVPDATVHRTVPRPGIPSREDDTGRDPNMTRPRTGTTGSSDEALKPGEMPPGYDKSQPRAASTKEQWVEDQMPETSMKGKFDPRHDTAPGTASLGAKRIASDTWANPEKPEKNMQDMPDEHKGLVAGMVQPEAPTFGSAENHEKRTRVEPEAEASGPLSPAAPLNRKAEVADPSQPLEVRSKFSKEEVEKHSSAAEPIFKPDRARELESKVAVGKKAQPVMEEGRIPGTLEADHRDHNKY
jgi:hypothetical protein